MTREDALDIFEHNWTRLENHDYTENELNEALNMAIKALEQANEPVGNSDKLDCISRQAVQDYIAKYLSQYLYNDVREAVEVIDEYIGDLPSVTPAPKTGHWIDNNGNFVPMKNGEPLHSCSCSNCGEWLVASDEYGVIGYYCPNCGAKMSEIPTGSESEE